jgi:hypothetical protein
MFSSLVDNPSPAYLILGVIAIVFALGWWMSMRAPSHYGQDLGMVEALKRGRLQRHQVYALGLAVVAALLLVVWLISATVVTDSKRIQRAVEEMAAGVHEKNFDKVFAHISDRFNVGHTTKRGLRTLVESYVRRGEISDVVVWGFEPASVSREKREATIEFMVKLKGGLLADENIPGRVLATFVLDPDGEWRLQSFQVFQPQTDPRSHQSIPLPL